MKSTCKIPIKYTRQYKILGMLFINCTVRAVTRRDNGGGVYIHILCLHTVKTIAFQKKSVGQNTNI
jgi:hypothetical protein